MAGDPRVRRLLEEMLDTGRSPEEVCRDTPELLPAVRERWRRFRAVQSQVGELFPEAGWTPAASATLPDPPAPGFPVIPGYEVLGVLGRGGMGVVYQARHLKLNRPVALKMLLVGAYARPEERERFLREAAAVAGLCHPNVVQVHDVGEQDGRPFFTMEFVEGGSLAQKLAGVPQSAREAAALTATLADAVQAAHAGGIVHRDLKPANVLLTADGRPKVGDFGLARKLDGEAGLTRSGAAVGTPSYMAPEQVRGDARATGPAADVYALGAILYEVLTGRPPFRAETAAATLRQVIAHDPVPPSRLNASVPRDLETVCLKCLHKEPDRRYPSAAALAEDLRRHLRGDPVAARPQGVLERLGRRARRRPALAVAAAGSVLLAAALVGGGLLLRAERAETARAKEQLDRQERARRDRAFVARLDAIHLNRSAVVEGRADWASNKARADREYEAAFREAGLGDVHDDAAVVAARVEASAVRESLVAALDDWAVCADHAADPRRQGWLLDVARRADPDPTGARDRLRDPAAWTDRETLTKLIGTAVAAKPSAQLLVALGERLRDFGGDSVPFLTRVQQEHPGDFWANLTLADTLARWAIKPGESVRYFQAALAIRPGATVAHMNLGCALALGGRTDEAMGYFLQAVRHDPDFAVARINLGNTLAAAGRHEGAIEEYRRAINLDPGAVSGRRNLGRAVLECGRVDEAIGILQDAVKLGPNDPLNHNGLGFALHAKGRWDDAAEYFRRAIELDPEFADAHLNLGRTLVAKGRVDEAVDHYKRALRIEPDGADIHHNLGLPHPKAVRVNDAIGHLRHAIRLTPEKAEYHLSLGNVLAQAGRTDEAISHYREAARLAPDDAKSQYNFALALANTGRAEEAIGPFQKAVRIAPALAEAHGALGLALLAAGRFGDAKAALDRCLSVLPPSDPRRGKIAEQVRRCDYWVALEVRLPGVLRGDDEPTPTDRLQLAEICHAKKRYAASARLYAQAFAHDPRAADPRTGYRYKAARSAAQAGCGRGEDGAGLGEPDRARWRDQARQWLRADLAVLGKRLDGDPAAARDSVRRTLTQWRAAPDLACLREPAELSTWPPPERVECLAFWDEVGVVLTRLPMAVGKLGHRNRCLPTTIVPGLNEGMHRTSVGSGRVTCRDVVILRRKGRTVLLREMVGGDPPYTCKLVFRDDPSGFGYRVTDGERVTEHVLTRTEEFERAVAAKVAEGFAETGRSLTRRVFVTADRFWIVALDAETLRTQSGGVGPSWRESSGQTREKEFRDRDRAVAAYHRAIADKLADGYRERYARSVVITDTPKNQKKPGKRKSR